MKLTEMTEEEMAQLFGVIVAAFLVAMVIAFGSFGVGLLFLSFGQAVGVCNLSGTITFLVMCRVFARAAFKRLTPIG